MNDENFKLISALSVPLGFHVTLCAEADTLTVSGNNDYANPDLVALAAGVMQLKLIFKWSKATPETITTLWRQYLVQVLRSFANGIEAEHFQFTGLTPEGLLCMRYQRPE